ncbi:MAG: AbrB/MazE/SpoVT family DNA-binding domain-containing protein [Pseudomonadota bacterium]
MGFNAKITSKGQITLPAEMRKAMKLQAGDSVTFTREADGRYMVVPETEVLADLRGIVKLDKTGGGKIKSSDIENWIGEARGRRGSGIHQRQKTVR